MLIKSECGEAMGISPQMEAKIAERDAVANTQQALAQNSLILEPFFSLHDWVKRNVMEALLDRAKVCYGIKKPKKLSYVLDDMSIKYFDMDSALLENSTLGIFMANATEIQKVKEMITSLSQVALQNQQAKFKDIISIMKQDSITEAENILVKSEKEAREAMMNVEQQKQNSLKEMETVKDQMAQKEFEREKELVILKEEEEKENSSCSSCSYRSIF